ncbi:MAG TPA: aldo/keto reductase [Candidatus Hydrogenedentes bacterium]|nr:aldo/keto reductase [Candidatus Hydrogenedentota bacterium]HPG67913.1 aldo/keto reductase [Candidatus Hydrogenedentota bacterium]
MQYRQLGTSELNVPVVSFGAWAIGGWMWGGTDDAAAIRAIQRGIDVGITCVDTAAAYGLGHSERVVGQALKGRRDRAIVATKCGLRWDLEEGQFFFDSQCDGAPCKIYRNLKGDSMKHEVEQSLQRLQTDYIDLYQCHWPDATTPIDETMAVLLELRDEGKIRAFGVSNFTPAMMEECLRTAPIASDQPKYSPLARDIEADVLPFCLERNIGVLAYSPIAQGLMTGKVTLDREFREGDQRRSNPWFSSANRARILDMLEKVKPIAQDHGATLAQVTINWVINQPGITTALVGARDERQVEENAKAADFRLTEDEMATIRTLVEELGGPV